MLRKPLHNRPPTTAIAHHWSTTKGGRWVVKPLSKGKAEELARIRTPQYVLFSLKLSHSFLCGRGENARPQVLPVEKSAENIFHHSGEFAAAAAAADASLSSTKTENRKRTEGRGIQTLPHKSPKWTDKLKNVSKVWNGWWRTEHYQKYVKLADMNENMTDHSRMYKKQSSSHSNQSLTKVCRRRRCFQ